LAIPRPREGGLRRGEIFWLHLTTASSACVSSERFLSFQLLLLLIVECYVRFPDASTAAGGVPYNRVQSAGVPITQDVQDQRQETAAANCLANLLNFSCKLAALSYLL